MYVEADYHTRSIWRFIKRKLFFLINLPRIIKNRKCRILVVVHFFYMESVDEIIEYLKNLQGYKFDLFITYIDGFYDQKKLDKIKRFKPDTELMEYKNKGYDIGPFIDLINKVNLDDYDVVIKMQSKSINKRIFIYNQFFSGRDWFLNLWDGVLGAHAVHNTIDKLFREKKYGLVAAKNLIVHDPEHKQELTKERLFNYGIVLEKDYLFVAGSCFALRAECLKKIKSLKISKKDFEETQKGSFSLAHALERAICFLVAPEYGYYGNKVDFWRKLKWRKVERDLRELSALNKIKKLGNYEIDAEYAWMGLEHTFLKKAEVCKVKLKDIRREHPQTGKVLKLEECEPYLYLKNKKNKKVYEDYCKYHQNGDDLPNMSIDRYEKLRESMDVGYDKRNPIIVNEKNVICDGQHRACILLYKHGEEYEIPVIKITGLFVGFSRMRPFFGAKLYVKRVEW